MWVVRGEGQRDHVRKVWWFFECVIDVISSQFYACCRCEEQFRDELDIIKAVTVWEDSWLFSGVKCYLWLMKRNLSWAYKIFYKERTSVRNPGDIYGSLKSFWRSLDANQMVHGPHNLNKKPQTLLLMRCVPILKYHLFTFYVPPRWGITNDSHTPWKSCHCSTHSTA